MAESTDEEKRTVEDRLREEYFLLLPDIRRVLWQLETEIQQCLLPIRHSLESHEQLLVRSRIKECESAIKTLREKQEGRAFDKDRPDSYRIADLPDLAGVRVLAFPDSRVLEADKALRDHFAAREWTSKHKDNQAGERLAYKYYGKFPELSTAILAEYQVVPMLIGLFWEVEHSALYKPPASYRATVERLSDRLAVVENALLSFGREFEELIRNQDK